MGKQVKVVGDNTPASAHVQTKQTKTSDAGLGATPQTSSIPGWKSVSSSGLSHSETLEDHDRVGSSYPSSWQAAVDDPSRDGPFDPPNAEADARGDDYIRHHSQVLHLSHGDYGVRGDGEVIGVRDHNHTPATPSRAAIGGDPAKNATKEATGEGKHEPATKEPGGQSVSTSGKVGASYK